MPRDEISRFWEVEYKVLLCDRTDSFCAEDIDGVIESEELSLSRITTGALPELEMEDWTWGST